MDDFMLVRDAAAKWGISERRVSSLCKDGRIDGAIRNGHAWMIPCDAGRPADRRVISGAYAKADGKRKLPLPVGISDYVVASTDCYYVDKTLMIRDVIDEKGRILMWTRPRRFGKTLNMDMLRVFFEKSGDDTSVHFRNMDIWRCGSRYVGEQGRYPVICLSFKDVKERGYAEAYALLRHAISVEADRHSYLLTSDSCSERDRRELASVIDGSASDASYACSLALLSRMLHVHHGTPAIIMIDEYDTPIQSAYANGYYEDMVSFMRVFLSSGLKDNRNLAYGFLTGILRVAKESLFSGLNNLKVYSILSSRYSSYFGFSRDEVSRMCSYYGVEDRMVDLVRWYDGYHFGSHEIFNPWSVACCLDDGCRLAPYWLATSSNDLIAKVIDGMDDDSRRQLLSLVQEGASLSTTVDTAVVYPRLHDDPSSVYSFLLMAGYLDAGDGTGDESAWSCTVSIPNLEVSKAFSREIVSRMRDIVSPSVSSEIERALVNGDGNALKEHLKGLLMRSASHFDTAKEDFFHGIVLCLCALTGGYYTTSNREAGDGRYDIQMLPYDRSRPGMLIELKAERGCSSERLKALAQEGLEQIRDRNYCVDLLSHGVGTIFLYSVAFSGKDVEIVCV